MENTKSMRKCFAVACAFGGFNFGMVLLNICVHNPVWLLMLHSILMVWYVISITIDIKNGILD